MAPLHHRCAGESRAPLGTTGQQLSGKTGCDVDCDYLGRTAVLGSALASRPEGRHCARTADGLVVCTHHLSCLRSPQAGCLLGCLLDTLRLAACCRYFLMSVATEWMTTTPYLGLKLWCLSWALLLLCPQVRPATPSFQQNAVCLGLVMGNAYGA